MPSSRARWRCSRIDQPHARRGLVFPDECPTCVAASGARIRCQMRGGAPRQIDEKGFRWIERCPVAPFRLAGLRPLDAGVAHLAAPTDGTTMPSTRSPPHGSSSPMIIPVPRWPETVVRRHLPQAAVSEAGSLTRCCAWPRALLAGTSRPLRPRPAASRLRPPPSPSSACVAPIGTAQSSSSRCSTARVWWTRCYPPAPTATSANPLEAGEIGTALQTLGSGEPVVRLRGGSSAGGRLTRLPGRPDPTAASGTAADRRWPVEQGKSAARCRSLRSPCACTFPRCCVPWK